MKSVHAALSLHHHKHTGKILHRKHTSYRVLFLLMLAPIIMMALVGKLATAADLTVTATVPAPMPSGAPLITSVADGSTTTQGQVLVEGTCPTIDPAVIIAIYDNGVLVGSAECTVDGTFSVPVSLSVGSHTLTAVIVTITGEIGASSPAVTIARIVPSHGGSTAPMPDRLPWQIQISLACRPCLYILSKRMPTCS